MDETIFEQKYKERLEEKIIQYIAELKNIDLTQAMDFYYSSNLSDKIEKGEFGIQYLDYKVPAQMMVENENVFV